MVYGLGFEVLGRRGIGSITMVLFKFDTLPELTWRRIVWSSAEATEVSLGLVEVS